jgi:hypothetical protein
MNYLKHYNALIERAKIRSLIGYYERHHVIPRCLGGSDDKANIVELTPEEHYVAHQLLVKMHPGDHRLLWAASAMAGGSAKQVGRQNKLYGWLRRKLAEDSSARQKGREFSDETRAKMSASHKGIKRGPHSEERKAKMSASHKGKVKSPEHRAAMSRSKTGKKRGPHSIQHRERLSQSIKASVANLDRSWMNSTEYKEHQRARMKLVWQRRRNGTLPMPNHREE